MNMAEEMQCLKETKNAHNLYSPRSKNMTRYKQTGKVSVLPLWIVGAIMNALACSAFPYVIKEFWGQQKKKSFQIILTVHAHDSV